MSGDVEQGSTIYGTNFAMIPECVLDAEISDRAVRLFACLARYANGAGRAFPGRKTIAARLRCSVDSVDRAMAELISIDAVRVERQDRKDGSQTSNNYYLWPLSGGPQPCGPPAAPPRPPGRTDAAPKNESQRNESQKDSPPTPSSPPPASGAEAPGNVVPLFDIPTEEEPAPSAQLDQAFALFWQIYPRKKGEVAAKAALKKALRRGVDIREIVEGAKRYRVECDDRLAKFVKEPKNWLAEQRWTDQPEETPLEAMLRRSREMDEKAAASS